MNDRQTVLVTGATGRQGGAVARHLLKAGWSVRGLTRDPDSKRAQMLADTGVDVVGGDMNDRGSLTAAMMGVAGVFSVQDFWSSGAVAEIMQGKNVVDAAKASGIRHLVYSSVASSDEATGLEHFESKYVIEQYIGRSEVPATILRPVSFMENYFIPEIEKGLLKGWLIDPVHEDKAVQLIATDDIGLFAALAFARPKDFVGRGMEIAGIQSTNREIAQTFAAVMGRKIRFRRMPMIAVRLLMGRDVHKMMKWLNEEGYKVDIDALRRNYPEVHLTSLEEWLIAEGWKNRRGPYARHDKTVDIKAPPRA